jgi:drug/metabolite transporter (DMT)-like permease
VARDRGGARDEAALRTALRRRRTRPPERLHGPQNLFFGIALYFVATLLFTVMGAQVRYIGLRVPIGEVVFARSLFALLPLLVWLIWRGEIRTALRTKRPWRHVTRGVSGVIALVANFAGLARLPLAEATAIGFATPLFTVVLAAIFLGERVRLFRWSAVAFGFVGVLVMLTPYLGYAEANVGSALGAGLTLAGAFLVSIVMTQVRAMSRTETTASLVFSYTAISTICALATLPWGWIVPGGTDAIVLVGIGVCGGIAQIAITESYRHAPASLVAPFAYTGMLWSIAIGFLVFSEVPPAVVLAGAALVMAAGLAVIWRERRLGLDRTKEKLADTPPGPAAV